MMGRILWEKKWVWIPAAILLLLDVAALAGYRYLFAERFSIEATRQAQLEKDWDAASSQNAALKKTLNSWKQASDGIEQFYALVGPRPKKLTPIIQEIEGLAQKAGVLPHQMTFGYADMPRGGLTEMRILFPFESTYAGVRNLLHLLEVTPSFIVTESVSLGASGELQDKIRLQFGLKTYFVQEARP
jgi:hypothetical protein